MEKNIKILSLGVESSINDVVAKEFPYCEIDAQPYDFKYFESPVTPSPAAILCGIPSNDELKIVEVAQSLRMIYTNIPIFFASTQRVQFNRKDMQKNGFTDAFLLPADQQVFSDTLRKLLSVLANLKSFRTVRLVDIPSENTLGFDLYIHMPANNKYMKFASATDVLSKERAERLKNYDIARAAVSEDQIKKFYEYTATQLSKLNSKTTISETEKRELREKAVRDLFTGIFAEAKKEDTIAQGQSVMNDCQEIIKSYILNECQSSASWFEKILTLANNTGGTYHHASNVSTYAALFAIGLGLNNVDEIALAGLLHDIGLADIPLEIAMKEDGKRTPEEETTYRRHPLLSVNMLKEKRMSVPENVSKIILQHHERYDGKGYPEQIEGQRIIKGAQIIAIADLFDYLTVTKPNKLGLAPLVAMEKIIEMNTKTMGEIYFDPQLIQQIHNLFKADKKAA